MGKTKQINRIKPIWEIILILLGQNDYRDTKWIKNHLDDKLGDDFKLRTVKSYLETIDNEFYFLESRKGFGGGYRLNQDARNQLANFATIQLSSEERNALNDAFEIAEKSPMFHYIPHLRSAKGKLYKDINLKDNDSEYYMGINLDKRETHKHIAQFKKAVKESVKIYVTARFDIGETKKERTLYTPLFLVHDTDETFLIFKLREKYVYQNLNNILSIELTDKKFTKFESEHISKHINGVSLSIKNKERHIVRIVAKSWEAEAIVRLWSHEYIRHEKLPKDVHEFEFAEIYKGLVFIFRLIEYIDIVFVSKHLGEQVGKKATHIRDRVEGQD